MKQILFLDACVRPDSRTRQLAQSVLGRMTGEVTTVSLEKLHLQPLNADTLRQRDLLIRSGEYSAPVFETAKQFAKADAIVLAAPYWDLSFPASVKIYLEAVSVLGLTFRYTPQGQPEGLCRAEKLIYVTTAGGKIGNADLGFDYVRALTQNLFGIPRVQAVRCEGLDLVGADPQAIVQKAQSAIEAKNF